MRKLLTGLLVVGFTLTLAHAEIGSWGGPQDTTQPEQIFLKVKNGESSAVTKGYIMAWDTTADDGVTVKLATTAAYPAACVMAVDSCAAGAFCKCQTFGYMSALHVSAGTNNIAAGQKIVMGAEGSVSGKGDGAATGEIVGIALDAATTTTTIEAFIKLR